MKPEIAIRTFIPMVDFSKDQNAVMACSSTTLGRDHSRKNPRRSAAGPARLTVRPRLARRHKGLILSYFLSYCQRDRLMIDMRARFTTASNS
jgi:hypothetical protein